MVDMRSKNWPPQAHKTLYGWTFATRRDTSPATHTPHDNHTYTFIICPHKHKWFEAERSASFGQKVFCARCHLVYIHLKRLKRLGGKKKAEKKRNANKSTLKTLPINRVNYDLVHNLYSLVLMSLNEKMSNNILANRNDVQAATHD